MNVFLSEDSQQIDAEFEKISKIKSPQSQNEQFFEKTYKNLREFFTLGGVIKNWEKCLILLEFFIKASYMAYNEILDSIVYSFRLLKPEEKDPLYREILKRNLHKGRFLNQEFKNFLLEKKLFLEYSQLNLTHKEIKKVLPLFIKSHIHLDICPSCLKNIKLSYKKWKYIIQNSTDFSEIFVYSNKTLKKAVKSIFLFGNDVQIFKTTTSVSAVANSYLWMLLFKSENLTNKINTYLIEQLKKDQETTSVILWNFLPKKPSFGIGRFLFNKLIKRMPILAYQAFNYNLKLIYKKNQFEAFYALKNIEEQYEIDFNLKGPKFRKLLKTLGKNKTFVIN